MDTVANEATLEAPSNGQAQPASGEQSQGSTAAGQNSQGGQSVDENIRKLQSIYDKKLADSQRQVDAAYQQMQALQRRLVEMEDASAPDDFARMENKLRRAEQRAQELEAYLAQQQQAQAEANRRTNTLTNLAIKYGVPVSALDKAQDYDEAVELAIEARAKAKAQAQKQRQEREDANSVDIGGGRAFTPDDEWQRQVKAAKERKDTAALMRLDRERRQREDAARKR